MPANFSPSLRSMFPRITLAAALLLAPTTAFSQNEPTSPPACKKSDVGRLWPDAVNRDPHLIRSIAQCHQIQVCRRTLFRYRWESVSIPLWQLANDEPPAGCQANPISEPVDERGE